MTTPVKTKRKKLVAVLPSVAFTDGDWKLTGLSIYADDETTIAVASTSKRDLGTCTTDLRLMAASKEMLAVCMAVMQTLVPSEGDVVTTGLQDLAQTALRKAGVTFANR